MVTGNVPADDFEKKATVKAGNKAATQYYKNMQQMDAIPPQFLDKKK